MANPVVVIILETVNAAWCNASLTLPNIPEILTVIKAILATTSPIYMCSSPSLNTDLNFLRIIR